MVMRALVALLATALAQLAVAQSATVTVTGYGQNRQQAVMDAQRTAVESGLGAAVEARTLVRDFIIESDLIRSVSSGVVTSSEILSARQDEAGLWSVTIRADVDADQLKGNIALMLRQIDSPKSMVIVDPFSSSNSEFARSAHRQLTAALVKEGFEVVNQDVSADLRAEIGSLMDVSAAGRSAARMALRFDADVAWMVVVRERPASAGYGLSQYTVDVACQVLSAASGRVFADAEISVNGVDAGDAARRAGSMLAEQLLDQVKISFADLAQEGNRYTVRLWGISSYRQARSFRSVLVGLPGFSSVKQNAIALDETTEKSFVDLSLIFKGTTEELIDQVFDSAKADSLQRLDLRLQRATQIEFQL